MRRSLRLGRSCTSELSGSWRLSLGGLTGDNPACRCVCSAVASGRCCSCADGCQEFTLDLWVNLGLVVAEPGLEHAAEVIDESLWLTGLQSVERCLCHGRRGDLREIDRSGHLGVHGAVMDGA